MSQVSLSKEISSAGYPLVASAATKPSVGDVRARLFEMSVSDLEALATEWQSLDPHERNQAPFFQSYWFKAFASTFAAGQPVPVVVVRRGEALAGILPLMYQERFLNYIPARTLGSLSGIHSCRFDFLCFDEDCEAVSLAVWHCLRDNARWSALEMRTVPDDGAFGLILKHAAREGFLTSWWPTLCSPYLTLPEQGSDPLQNCPAKYKPDRKRLKKYEGRLKELGAISFEVYETFSERLFSDFLELEGAGWKGKAGGAIRCSPVVTQFYRTVLEEASRYGHLRMCTLRAGDRLVAIEMAFVVGDTCFSPKIAYDEQLSRCAPGHILTVNAIRDLAARGVKVYDFLGAKARHKSLWAGEERPHGTAFIFRPTLQGKAYHAVAAKVAPQAKRIKHYLYGDPQGKK